MRILAEGTLFFFICTVILLVAIFTDQRSKKRITERASSVVEFMIDCLENNGEPLSIETGSRIIHYCTYDDRREIYSGDMK